MSVESVKQEAFLAMQEGDIKKLYLLLEKEESLNEAIYTNIIELSMEYLTDKLEQNSSFDLSVEREMFTLRALYEYAISYYNAQQFSDASALFDVLSSVADDKVFVLSMNYHKAASEQKIPLDEFIDKYTNISDNLETFYINDFKQKAQDLLKREEKDVK